MSRHEAKFLTAFGRLNDPAHLPDDGLVRALSRSVADPETFLARLSAPLDTVAILDADLVTVTTVMRTVGVLPGFQPRGRAGRTFRHASDPVASDSPTGQSEMTFRDVEHLRRWTADNIARSLKLGLNAKRHLQIASTGVRKPVTCHLATLIFEDGTQPMTVVLLRDGITRWSISQGLVWGVLDSGEMDAANAIVEQLLPLNIFARASNPRALIGHWSRLSARLATDYAACVTNTGPDEEGLLIRQPYTLPATVCLGVVSDNTEPYPIDRAMRSVVSDVHTDVSQWDEADSDLFTAEAAIEELLARGHITADERDLFLDRVPASAVDDLFPPTTDAPEQTCELRRAVAMVAHLISPAMYDNTKKVLRDIGGYRAVHLKHVVKVIAPLFTRPWALHKPTTRIWSYEGGPVSKSLVIRGLTPVGPADYRDLVQPAQGGDVNAAGELYLAGGIALMADGIITTALIGGSGGAKESMARMSPATLLEGLTSTEEGLTALALAANAFRASSEPGRSRLPDVDLTCPDGVHRDNAGKPKEVSLRRLIDISAAGQDPGPGPDSDDEDNTDQELFDSLRLRLPGLVRDLRTTAEDTLEFRDKVGHGGSVLKPSDAQIVSEDLFKASQVMGKLL